jgi:transcriptional regulator with XRE-family HTH domain
MIAANITLVKEFKKPTPKPPRLKKQNTTSLKVKKSPLVTSSIVIDVPQLRVKLGLTQPELARMTGYSTRSIAGWEKGRVISASAIQKFRETEKLQQALSEMMPSEKVIQWLRQPNLAFEGQTPIQVIERGDVHRIWEVIYQIHYNIAT